MGKKQVEEVSEAFTVRQFRDHLRRNVDNNVKGDNRPARAFVVDGVYMSGRHARRDFYPKGLVRVDEIAERLKDVQLSLPMLYFPASGEFGRILKTTHKRLSVKLAQNAVYRMFVAFPDIEELSGYTRREWSYAINRLFVDLYETLEDDSLKVSERLETINVWLEAIGKMVSFLEAYRLKVIEEHRKQKGTDRVLSKKIARKKKRGKKRGSAIARKTTN